MKVIWQCGSVAEAVAAKDNFDDTGRKKRSQQINQ